MQSLSTKTFLPIVIYYLTVGFFLIGSLYPESRFWAVNFWPLFPSGWNQLFVVISLVLPLPIFIASFFKLRLRSEFGDDAENRFSFMIYSGVFLILSSFIFYIFRAQTFFLGDGYGMLSLLSSASPAYLQVHELGESLVHLWVYDLTGAGGESSALAIYQIISIVAGGLFVATVLFGAYRLFARNSDRIMFSAGILSCGYVLMAFGYVENYSLFLLSVLLFTLISLLAVLGKINRLLVLPALAISVFFHVLGVALIPAALYVLFQRCVHRSWRRGQSKSLMLGLFILLTAGLVLFKYLYTTDYGFRLAFVPFITDRFTIDGYTLFSPPHFIDVINLLFILVPSLPVFVSLLFILPMRQFTKQKEVRLLLLLSVSVVGTALIFNPRLGMPRDWDLFAFVGLPIAVLMYYTLVSQRKSIRRYSCWVSACIAIGLVSLIPRVAALNQPDVALARFRQHIDLDKKKNRYVSQLLKDYYTERGDMVGLDELAIKWSRYYPETKLVEQADSLVEQKKYHQAIRVCEQAVEQNPIYVRAYATLVSCYIGLGNYDSAMTLLKIAEGFSPDRSPTLSQMAMINFLQGKYEQAEKLWLNAYALDTAYFDPLQGLARIYLQQGRSDECLYFLSRAVRREDTPLSALVDLGNLYLSHRDYENASRVFQRAIDKGLDSSFVNKLKEAYPQVSFRLTDVSKSVVKQIDN